MASASVVANPFGWPVVAYLTLAGTAAGLAIAGAVALVSAREHLNKTARLALLGAIVLVAGGAIALIVDLESPARFWMILAYFNPASWMAWGARALVLLAILASLVWFLARSGRPAITSELLVIVAAFVALYPALVLRQAAARPLWDSMLLAPLFLASGLHMGLALMGMGGPAFRDDEWRVFRRVELVLIVGQGLLLGAYFLTHDAGGLTAAPTATWLWAGVVGAGLVVPLAALVVRSEARANLMLRGACVLIGGLSVRTLFIIGGQGTTAFVGGS